MQCCLDAQMCAEVYFILALWIWCLCSILTLTKVVDFLYKFIYIIGPCDSSFRVFLCLFFFASCSSDLLSFSNADRRTRALEDPTGSFSWGYAKCHFNRLKRSMYLVPAALAVWRSCGHRNRQLGQRVARTCLASSEWCKSWGCSTLDTGLSSSCWGLELPDDIFLICLSSPWSMPSWITLDRNWNATPLSPSNNFRG